MPSLSIYDAEGYRPATDEGERSEHVRRFRELGGRLTMDVSRETTRILVAFEARDPESGSAGQYYAVYSGNPRQLHRGLQRRLQERYGLALVTGEEAADTVYDLFVPGSETDEPAETDRLDAAAALLSDPEESDQVRVGAGSDRQAVQAVRYFLGKGYTRRVAVAEDADAPELSGFGLVVETGAHDGIELLPETAATLGRVGATGDADGSPTREQDREETADAGQQAGETAGPGQQGETSPGGETSPDRREWVPAGLGGGDGRQRTAVLLGAFGALALVVVLALGTALGGGIPFVGGDGGGSAGPEVELDTAELRGADGVVVEGQLEGGSVEETEFTLRLWEGRQGDGDPLLTTQVAGTSRGNGTFGLSVGPGELEAAADGFDPRDGDYEVAVETASGASAATTLEPGALNLTLDDVAWTEGSLAVTGRLTQAGVPLRGEPAIEVTVDEEPVSPHLRYEDNGTVTFSVSDNQTGRDLTGGGELTVTAAYGGLTDSITAQRPEPAEPAVFEVTVTEVSTPVTAGEQLTVTAAVENTGERPGTQTVTAEADGLGSDGATVSLDERGSRSLTLAVGTGQGDGGEYTLTVASENSSDTTSVTVESPEPLFQVGISATNAPVTVGETLTVTAGVLNAGDGEGTATVEFDAGPLGGDSASVSLSAGESTTQTFSVETGRVTAGEYEVAVTVGSDEDTLVLPVESDDGGVRQ